MTEYHDPNGMFERLMALNREAFEAGHYNTAYHTLAAALHTTYAHQDTEGLATVERLAAEQLAEIDSTDPEYEHSTPAAEARGQHSIFTMLVNQAHTRRLMLQRDQPQYDEQ